MEFTGRYHIPAMPETVWAGLNDPDILEACIAGCEKLEKTSPTEFTASATLKIGPMTARFGGKIALAEIDVPHCCIIRGEGSGAAGFAKGEAAIVLTAADGGTDLAYTAKAAIGGKLAQIGQRLLDGTARQVTDDFFARFAAKLAPVPTAPRAVLPDHNGLAPVVWVAGLGVLAVIVLILFGLVL